MSVRRLHTAIFRPNLRPSACSTWSRSRPTSLQACSRRFATHKDPLPSSLLTSALDQKQRNSQGRDESVGPFQLGMQPGLRHGEKVKKWSELSTGGKGNANKLFCCDIRLLTCNDLSDQGSCEVDEPDCHSDWGWLLCYAYICIDLRAVLAELSDGFVWQSL